MSTKTKTNRPESATSKLNASSEAVTTSPEVKKVETKVTKADAPATTTVTATKPKDDVERVELSKTSSLRLVKNGKVKALRGEGTIAEVAELFGMKIPSAHGLVNGLVVIGVAVPTGKRRKANGKGRTAEIYAIRNFKMVK